MTWFRCIGNDSGGGGGGSTHEDIFSMVQISATNGVTVLTNGVANRVGAISCQEYSAGFEGFNIAMPNLTVNKNYIVNFDFQFTTADWFSGQYRTGVKIRDTNYSGYDNWSDWTENIDRDLLLHNHQMTFTATASTMYLSFNLCGCSDNQNNYFNVTNLYVEEATS